jgi:hypothetical protein
MAELGQKDDSDTPAKRKAASANGNNGGRLSKVAIG